MIFHNIFKRKNKNKNSECFIQLQNAIVEQGNPWVSLDNLNTDNSIYFKNSFIAKKIETCKEGFIKVTAISRKYLNMKLEIFYNSGVIKYIRLVSDDNKVEELLSDVSVITYRDVINANDIWKFYKSCRMGKYNYRLKLGEV